MTVYKLKKIVKENHLSDLKKIINTYKDFDRLDLLVLIKKLREEREDV